MPPTAWRAYNNSMITRTALLAIPLLWTSMVQQPETPKTQEPVIRVTTELIEVRVVVTDKKGNPVPDLTRDDFILLENKSPQEISFFSAVRVNEPQGTGSGATDRRPSPAIKNRARDVTGPRVQPTAKPSRTVMIFVDNLHISIPNLVRLKKDLNRFIDESLTDEDLVALVTTATSTGLAGQFTRNREVLKYAVDKLRPGPAATRGDGMFTPYLAGSLMRGDRAAMDVGILVLQLEGYVEDEFMTREVLEGLTRAEAMRVLSEASYRRDVTLGTLKAVAETMTDLPGQRLLALYSDGFTMMDSLGGFDTFELRNTINRAVLSGVVIYSIDSRGLQTPSYFGTSIRGVGSQSLSSYMDASERDAENIMNALAKDTGGEPFFDTNDLAGALTDALDANRYYYVLAYYPKNINPKLSKDGKKVELDNKFRKFTVRVKNHPEYKVRTQKGYLPADLVKIRTEEEAQTPEQRFHDAVMAPLPITDIGISAWADFIDTGGDDAQASLHVQVEGKKLDIKKGMEEEKEVHRLALQLVTYVLDKDGKSVESKTHTIEGKLPPSLLEQARGLGIHFTRRLSLQPGLYQVRVGVRQGDIEQFGTGETWIDIPELSAKKFSLSSIVLDGWSEDQAAPAETTQVKQAQSKVMQGIKLYSTGHTFAYYMIVYGNTTSGLRSKTELLQNGKPIETADWELIADLEIGRIRMGEPGKEITGIVIGDKYPLELEDAGVYELLISVEDPKSKRILERSVVFGIEDPTADE